MTPQDRLLGEAADLEVIAYHGTRQHELLLVGAGNSKDRDQRQADLILAMRHGLAGWVMQDATPKQLFQITNLFKTSPKN